VKRGLLDMETWVRFRKGEAGMDGEHPQDANTTREGLEKRGVTVNAA
jgi:hypothetical protein